MFHQSRCWINLGELLLRDTYNRSIMIEDDCSRTRCSLIQRQYVLCHRYPSFFSWRRGKPRACPAASTRAQQHAPLHNSVPTCISSDAYAKNNDLFECIGNAAYARSICEGKERIQMYVHKS